MSWADDIRCLYCDGKLPLYKKITNGQFCSSAHQKAYWHDQERLALERLRDSYPPSPAIQPEQASEIIDIEAYPSFEAGGNPAVSAGEAFKAISRTEPDLRGLLGEQWPRPIRHVSG